MRNFEERMDEIRRRSARILEKKKQRKRLLLACVPVLVCGILLVGLLAKMPGKTPAPPVSMEFSREYTLLNDSVTLYRVELSLEEAEGENKPAANQSIGGSGEFDKPILDDFSYGDVSASLSEQPTGCCCFKAVSEDGAVTYYTLEGNLLTNTLTGEARTLTDSQLEALLQLLEERGITP